MRDTKYVILEGISGCGKSALLNLICELTNYRDFVQMRYAPSLWVYNRLYNRQEYDYEHMNQMLDENQDACIIWLQVEPEEAYRRKREKNDSHMIEDLVKANDLYTHYFDKICTMRKVHRVKTDDRTLEDVLTEINDKIYSRNFHDTLDGVR